MEKVLRKKDKFFMREALRLAEKGRGYTKLNPLVGAVVVKKRKIIARGYHARFGGPHAEVMALQRAHARARGATLYVTLEPCSTYGKTPPCTELIIKRGIKKVVVGMYDPNPIHARRGVQILKRKGIAVAVGLLSREVAEQNAYFIKLMKTGRPYIILKMAQSLDGKIATYRKDARWITGIQSRTVVHTLRSEVDAILVGKRTVLTDNPSLNVRLVPAVRQPIRVILDKNGEIPLRKKVFRDGRPGTVIVAVSKNITSSKLKSYAKRNITALTVPLKKGRLNLKILIKRLLQYNIGTMLIEGGGETAAAFFEDQLIDKVYFFTAPIIIGGRDAPTTVAGEGVRRIAQAVRLSNCTCTKTGNDYLFTAEPVYEQ